MLEEINIHYESLHTLICTYSGDLDADGGGVEGGDTETDASFYDKLFELQPLFNFIETYYKKIPKERASLGKPTPRVNITVSFEDSWYDQPLKDGEEDNLDNWKSHKGKFPDPTGINGSCIVPHDKEGKKGEFLYGVPTHFVDPKVERFLTGPLLATRGKVSVEEPYCLPGSVNIGDNNKLIGVERLLRHSLKSSLSAEFLVSELIDRNMRLLASNRDIDWKEEIVLNNKMLYFIEKCICRTTGFSTGSHVNIKLMLRDLVLDKLYGNDETKDNLRYSSFATDGIFGPLPSAFAGNLEPHSNYRGLYILSTVPTAESSLSSGHRTPATKRTSGSSWISPPPKTATTSKQVQLVSASEALRGNKSKGGQSFHKGRGGRGRGKGRGSWRGKT